MYVNEIDNRRYLYNCDKKVRNRINFQQLCLLKKEANTMKSFFFSGHWFEADDIQSFYKFYAENPENDNFAR